MPTDAHQAGLTRKRDEIMPQNIMQGAKIAACE